MRVKTFALYTIIGILVVTALIVFAHAKISGNAVLDGKQKILPGVPTPDYIKPYPKPKPIYPPDDDMHILPVPKPSCKEGGRRCVGNNLQGCIGGEWIVMATCRPGTTCSRDGCKAVQPGCNTGARRCSGINLEGCINSQWEVLATCRSGSYCTTSGCQPVRPSCNPGARRCLNNNLQACIGDQWITTAVCGQDQYCSSQGCITIPPTPSNIVIFGAQGLSCPTKPSPLNVPFPDPVYKVDDCDLHAPDVELYIKSLENSIATCSQLQGQQLTLATADKQYIEYQISLLYPQSFPTYPYAPTCSLTPPLLAAPQPTPIFTPSEGKERYTDWLKFITKTATTYCALVQTIINPVVDGCTNINANLPVCGADYNAQVAYFTYLNGQMGISSGTAIQATALSSAFSFNINQFRDALTKTGFAC